jgi:peroxiredoxin
MKKTYFLQILVPFVISAASCQAVPSGKSQVSCEFANGAGKKIVLQHLGASAVLPVDSITLDASGKGTFALDVKQPRFYRLQVSPENFLVFIASENDKKISINSDYNNLASKYKISGSEESTLLQSTSSVLQRNYMMADSMQQVYTNLKSQGNDSAANTLEKKYMMMLESETAMIHKLVDEHPASLAAMAMLERLDKDKDIAFLEKVDAALSKKYPDSEYSKSLHERIGELKKLHVGSIAPDISLPTPDGQTLALSSLKGQVVLLDFWASWCRPCRMENPNVVNIYNKYHDKGFTVFSVSLDKSKDSWVEAITKDGLLWPNHVSDLGYWNSIVTKLYKIEGIPMTFVLDKEGRIAAKNLRGKELEDKIAGLLSR